MSMVASAPSASMPMSQVTVLDPEHDPWLGADDTNCTVDGSVSLTVTLSASSGPSLLAVRWYVMSWPVGTTFAGPDWSIARSDVPGTALTVVLVESVLFEDTG